MAIQGVVDVSSASTLTLSSAASIYIYNGAATATWTLPAVSGNSGEILFLYNRGAAGAIVTVTRAGSNQIDNQGALVNTVTLAPNSSLQLIDDGTYWLAINAAGSLPLYDNSALSTNHQFNSSHTVSSGTAVTWTHTVGAGNPYGIVCLYANEDTTTPSNTTAVVTFGGVTLTQQGYINQSGGLYLWVFGGPNIPSGSQTVSVTLTRTSATFGFTGGSYTYLNVATVGAFVDLAEVVGNAIPLSLTVPRLSALPAKIWFAEASGTTNNTEGIVASSLAQRQFLDGGNANFVTSYGGDMPAYGPDNATPVMVLGNSAQNLNCVSACLELFGQIPSGPYMDRTGASLEIVSAGGGSANTFANIAAAGSYVLLAVMYLKNTGTSLGGASYGGSAMTQLANKFLNNDATGNSGQLFLYGIANVTGGTQTVALTYTGGVPAVVNTAAMSYYGVNSVGTAATVSGTGTSLSQGPVSCSTAQAIFQCFGSFDLGQIVMTETTSYNLYSAAALFSQSGGLSINHSRTTTTFTATTTDADPWAGIAVVLS